MAATKGLLLASNRNILVEYGDHIHLSRYCAQALLESMEFVKRKGTTYKSKRAVTGLKEIKKDFLLQVVQFVKMVEISEGLKLNWDQTGLNIMPSSS